MRSALSAFLAALAVMGAFARAGTGVAPDWIADHGGTLELKLAHQESNGLDGGILRVDPTRRLVLWEGIPGELGCKLNVEASFDDVKGVRARTDGGFAVELRREKPPKLVFMPLPDAPWFSKSTKVAQNRLAQVMHFMPLTGPDGQPLPLNGAVAFGGDQIRHIDLPPEVVADVNMAVTLIRGALGRAPSPSGALQEALYGRPMDVSVQEVLETPATYAGRTVRLRGRIQRIKEKPSTYRLMDGEDAIPITPLAEVAAVVGAEVGNDDEEVEITGVLRSPHVESPLPPEYAVAFWEYNRPGAAPTRPLAPNRLMTLEDLVTHPGTADGQVIRVVGKFRGRNLHLDLPANALGSGWVIKAGKYAVEVRGKKPSGPGFKLDQDSMNDTVNWIEVLGRPETHNGVTVLHALKVAPVAPPSAAGVASPRRLRGVAGRPTVVFALPLDGERGIAADSRLVVQFSAYMDEDSFRGHVRVRYADGGDLPRMSWRYDDARRALIVDPGEPLRPGGVLELLLLPGIVDVDFSPLAPRANSTAEGGAEVLRYVVEG
jgi:Bacterial Ig-like domain